MRNNNTSNDFKASLNFNGVSVPKEKQKYIMLIS